MEVSVRELKTRLSAYLRKLKPGDEITVTSHGKPVARILPPHQKRSKKSPEEEAIAFLRSQPWIRPGKAGKIKLPEVIVRLKPGEQTLAEIVSEQRGDRR